MEVLDKYHGQASGIFSCDEHLAGLMPSRGQTNVWHNYNIDVLMTCFE